MSPFLFELPPERIASKPLPVRSQSKLMIIDQREQMLLDSCFYQLPDFLQAGDLLVFNNSKVIRARLIARKATGARVEICIDRIIDAGNALALLRSNRPIQEETTLLVADLAIKVLRKKNPFFLVQLQSGCWQDVLEAHGTVPLPPYIRRPAEKDDQQRYQTVYARVPGSVAAPTAGLHFDSSIFEQLARKSVSCAWLQLHVGYGTFAPLRTADVKHLHAERYQIDATCCQQILQTKQAGGRVIAVGTTTTRVLETVAQKGFTAHSGETTLFIKPGFRFACVDALVTNFHLPGSSLLHLVAAFAGADVIMRAYKHAIDNNYRFYSYGDAMYIARSR